MTASTWLWKDGAAGSPETAADWSLLSGPGNGSGVPQPGDTAINAGGTITFDVDAQLSGNTIELGGTAGTAALVFVGDTAVTFATPSIDSSSLITSAVTSAGTFVGNTTVETSLLDARGIFITEGTIAAAGPAGSSFTIAITGTTINSVVQAGSFSNSGLIEVDAGNSMTLSVGSGAELFNTGRIVANGGTLTFSAAADAANGGFGPVAGDVIIENGGTVETNVAYAANLTGEEPVYEFAPDGSSGNVLKIDNVGSFGGAIVGFGKGDTIDLGVSLSVGKVAYSSTTGILALENSAGTILASLYLGSGNFQSSTQTVSGGVAGSFTLGTGGDGNTTLSTDVQNDVFVNSSGSWQSTGLWSDGVPGTLDSAFVGLNATSAFTVTTGAQPVQVGALILSGSQTLLQITSNGTVGPYPIREQAGTLEVTSGNTLTATLLQMLGGATEIDADAQLTLTGHKGLKSVGAVNGTLTSSGTIALEVDGGTLSINGGTLSATGSVSNTGSITIVGGAVTISGVLTGGGTVSLASGGILALGSAASGGTITFGAGSSELELGADTGFTDTISGLNVGAGGAKTDFINITGSHVTIASVSGQGGTSGTITLSDGAVLDLTNLSSTSWFANAIIDGAGTDIYVSDTACYCRGTRIMTDRGEVPVEVLGVGARLVTRDGTAKPVKWIGRRSYVGWLAAGNPKVMPVCFKPGSLADGVPRRDLWVSPEHAIYLDGVLVPAELLVNGTSIVKSSSVDEAHYFHLELDAHDVILAEGAWAESFVDDDSRMMFHNAAEYRELYPKAPLRAPARYCAPRVEDGFELEALRRKLAGRARRLQPDGTAPAAVLEGNLEVVRHDRIAGWVRDPVMPAERVALVVYANGGEIGRVVADRYRADLQEAGIGDGRHAFELALPGGLTLDLQRRIEVCRGADGALLPGSPAVLERAAAG